MIGVEGGGGGWGVFINSLGGVFIPNESIVGRFASVGDNKMARASIEREREREEKRIFQDSPTFRFAILPLLCSQETVTRDIAGSSNNPIAKGEGNNNEFWSFNPILIV